jgi:hypothetical protein
MAAESSHVRQHLPRVALPDSALVGSGIGEDLQRCLHQIIGDKHPRETYGARVTQAASVDEALSMLPDNHLVITDMAMPLRDGGARERPAEWFQRLSRKADRPRRPGEGGGLRRSTRVMTNDVIGRDHLFSRIENQ